MFQFFLFAINVLCLARTRTEHEKSFWAILFTIDFSHSIFLFEVTVVHSYKDVKEKKRREIFPAKPLCSSGILRT